MLFCRITESLSGRSHSKLRSLLMPRRKMRRVSGRIVGIANASFHRTLCSLDDRLDLELVRQIGVITTIFNMRVIWVPYRRATLSLASGSLSFDGGFRARRFPKRSCAAKQRHEPAMPTRQAPVRHAPS